MKNVLVTGAAGRIGTAFTESARGRYALRLADIVPVDGGADEMLRLDITDPVACRQACRDIHTVVHLAADPSPNADFYDSVLPVNIAGTYNMFEAARAAGCTRVVYASSVQVIEGYPPDVQAHPETPVRPQNMYGAGKCFGEALAASFASAYGLEAVAVRIGWFEHAADHETASARNMSAWVSPRDLCQLLVQCIDAPVRGFAIAHGVSDNRFKRMSLSATRDRFGYAPRDDAFRVWALPQ